MAEQTIHQGKNIKRFREMQGMKPEALATELGDDWTQKKIVQLEGKQTIEKDLLEQVAKVLNVSPEAIQTFDEAEEVTMNFISNTFEHGNYSFARQESTQNTLNINPIEKWLEAMAVNKQLYERLVESEKEKVALLQQLIDKLSK